MTGGRRDEPMVDLYLLLKDAPTPYLSLTYNQMAQTAIREILHLTGFNHRALADADAAYNGVYAKAPYPSDLRNPAGTFTSDRIKFDREPFENLRWAARAYTLDILQRTSDREVAAGIYRAGKIGEIGYADRVNQFHDEHGGYDEFFKCLRSGR